MGFLFEMTISQGCLSNESDGSFLFCEASVCRFCFVSSSTTTKSVGSTELDAAFSSDSVVVRLYLPGSLYRYFLLKSKQPSFSCVLTLLMISFSLRKR
jgi:hypothetical protein